MNASAPPVLPNVLSPDAALAALRARHVERNPASRAAMAAAEQWMPGGNTRSVLHYDPFPVVIERGEGARLRDIDGHDLLDCVGEFSAGLYGHSEPAIVEAIREALGGGIVLGGPNRIEPRLAEVVCGRFPSIERVRFCNSGTEANLFAAVTARAVTGRPAILVFDGAYHGGLMSFGGGGSPMNVPFEWIVVPYNDADAVRQAFRWHGSRLAAAFVEPVIGAAGNIPGEPEFMSALRAETAAHGTILVFDEVKTSRLGRSGVQGVTGVIPDMTTLGKYLGGGLPLGAFGGKAEIMDRFDPRRAGGLKHAGTFNNNVCSMAAGLAGLTQVFTPERADAFLARTEAFRMRLAAGLRSLNPRVHVTGLGSLISLHLADAPPRAAGDVTPATGILRSLLHLHALERGVALTGRGDIFLSLPMTDADLDLLGSVIADFLQEYEGVLEGLAKDGGRGRPS